MRFYEENVEVFVNLVLKENKNCLYIQLFLEKTEKEIIQKNRFILHCI